VREQPVLDLVPLLVPGGKWQQVISNPVSSANAASSAFHLVSDALGSVRGVVNSTGALAASTSYDAWGNPQTTGEAVCRSWALAHALCFPWERAWSSVLLALSPNVLATAEEITTG
jgi:hypothetical protein